MGVWIDIDDERNEFCGVKGDFQIFKIHNAVLESGIYGDAPKFEWIPCDKKLPDEGDYNSYLLTDEEDGMAVGLYRHDAQAWDSDFGWVEQLEDSTFGIGKVVAYMPLPPRYRRNK